MLVFKVLVRYEGQRTVNYKKKDIDTVQIVDENKFHVFFCQFLNMKVSRGNHNRKENINISPNG